MSLQINSTFNWRWSLHDRNMSCKFKCVVIFIKIKQIVTRQKERKNEKYFSTQSLDYYIEQSNRDIREGPYYICVVCNRLLYRKTVLEFKKDKYNCSSYLFTSVTSFNGDMYICNTCHVTIKKKNKTPCQAACNNLTVDDVPPELATLELLNLNKYWFLNESYFRKLLWCQEASKGKLGERFVMSQCPVKKPVMFYQGHLIVLELLC